MGTREVIDNGIVWMRSGDPIGTEIAISEGGNVVSNPGSLGSNWTQGAYTQHESWPSSWTVKPAKMPGMMSSLVQDGRNWESSPIGIISTRDHHGRVPVQKEPEPSE